MIFAIEERAVAFISNRPEFDQLENVIVRLGQPAKYVTGGGRIWDVYCDPRVTNAHLVKMRNYLLARGATQTQIDNFTYHSAGDVIPPGVTEVPSGA